MNALCRCLRLTLFALLPLLAPGASAAPLTVVASFSLLADMTRAVGGERVAVHTLVGENADAHVYQPTPADARELARARLVIVNGLGFEGWIDRLVAASGYRGQVLVASRGVKALPRPRSTPGSRAAEDADPHAWQDISNALRYVDNIAGALATADPAGAAVYRANAARYKAALAQLDDEVRRRFAALPAGRRSVVTTHDAFAYFGRAYGIAFIAPVGISTDAEPSALDIGRVIRQVRAEKIPAVFMESISDPRLLDRIRRESGARIGGTLYSDSLSAANGPAPTYLEMMRYNARTIEQALKD